jgi:hypothetical protein
MPEFERAGSPRDCGAGKIAARQRAKEKAYLRKEIEKDGCIMRGTYTAGRRKSGWLSLEDFSRQIMREPGDIEIKPGFLRRGFGKRWGLHEINHQKPGFWFAASSLPAARRTSGLTPAVRLTFSVASCVA